MAVDRLSALDRMMLWASRRWPQDIGVAAILDGESLLDPAGKLRIDLLRAAIASRLHLVPRFRQVIRVPGRGFGGPYWADAPTFEVACHVRELHLEPPGGEDKLLRAVEELLRQRLDPSRPLWEMWFLTGLPRRRVGLFVRIHHAIADGMAAMMTIAAFLDSGPRVAVIAPRRWTPAPWPSRRALVQDNLARRLRAAGRSLSALTRPRMTVRRLRAAWPAIREIVAEEPATATSLDRTVGPARRFAVVRTDFQTVKTIGRRHGATVNDVLLAVTAAGLRALIRSRGEPVDRTTVRIYVPVSLRRHLRGRQQGNVIAQMAVPLHLGEADRWRRLDAITAETRRRKGRARTSLSSLLVGGPIGRRLLLLAVMRQRVNATSASIPGPKKPLYLAGAPVLDAFPLLPLVANEPLAVGALSYAGTLAIGVAADRDAFPDLDVFTGAVRDELGGLGLPARPSCLASLERPSTAAI